MCSAQRARQDVARSVPSDRPPPTPAPAWLLKLLRRFGPLLTSRKPLSQLGF